MADSVKKVAIVTGSTQGLGEAIARRLVDEALIGGLVICGRSTENGERLAHEFSSRGCRTGRRALPMCSTATGCWRRGPRRTNRLPCG